MSIKKLIGFLVFTHIISILWLGDNFNQLIVIYQVANWSLINLFIVIISLLGHLLGIAIGSKLFEFLDDRIHFNVYRNVVLKNKSNLFILFYLGILSIQFLFYFKHFGSYIIAETIDVEFLIGNISPLFPGQIGLFFLTIFTGIVYSRIYNQKILFVICLIMSFFLLKKYLLLLGVFYLIYASSKKVKLILLVSTLFLYALIDSFRTNTEGVSFQFRPDNYFSISMINFIEMWDKAKFSKDYFYQMRGILGGEYIENIDFPEPTSGPGYVGSLFVNGSIIYGLMWSIIMGLYFFYLNYRCNRNNFFKDLLSPLFLFGLFMTLQGNIFLNPILFILPFLIVGCMFAFLVKKEALNS